MNKLFNTLSIDRDNANASLDPSLLLKVIKKQKNKCFCCSINLDIDPKLHKIASKNKKTIVDDLIAMCPLCYYPQNLNDVDDRVNLIILLPEISQIELNALQRALAVVDYQIGRMIKSSDDGKTISKTYEISELRDTIDILNIILKERADFADTYFSKGSSNVDIVSNGLRSLSDEDYEMRAKGIYGLRLYHDMSRYSEHLESWSVAFNNYKIENWKKLIVNTAKKINK